nr:MAG TPA: hypothetical protein [Caudoviricetes sp.]
MRSRAGNYATLRKVRDRRGSVGSCRNSDAAAKYGPNLDAGSIW